ncbi:hypothetical protein QYE76_022576 [Lolium multiflorum]|uniref:Retrotransposon gag domain-containing protein n=1 Tax=Lolium multiflorum TaxID=4521 RepID=A0AAD8VS05_LOLMU|nr:hypothetical protein QYE76_022576 [Lolium multiflorum]
MAEEQITYEDLPADHKKKYDELKAIVEAELIGSFEKTRSHGISSKDSRHKASLKGGSVSPFRTYRALRQEINYVVAHSLHRHSESLVNSLERVALQVVQEIMRHQYSPSGPALGTHHGELVATSSTADQIGASERPVRHLKKKIIGYSKPYPNEFDLIPLPPKYRLPDFTKFSGSEGSSSIEHVSRYLAQLGMVSASDQLRVRFFSQSLTGPAFGWYTSLQPNSIRSWKQLDE